MKRIRRRSRRLGAVVGVLAVAVGLVVAQSVSAEPSKSAKAEAGPLVAMLLPENVTPRWESSDKPLFIKAMKQLVPDVRIDVLNALNDPARQQAQAEAELTKGAKVLVIAAIDQKAAAVIVRKAASQGVPTIAYDRLIKNAPLAYYDSFDSVAVGRAEAGWLVKHTKKGARIAVVNGSPTDDNAHLVNQGMLQVLRPLFKSGARVQVANQWVPGWDPSKAQTLMEQILTRTDNRVDGVSSANDGMAGGIIAALKAQGLAGKVPVTGQDASLEGLQRVVLGTQGVSVFKDFRLQAPAAAKIAAAILAGKKPTNINATVANGQVKVPSVMLKVEPIDRANIAKLVGNGWIDTLGGLQKFCKGLPKTSICK